MEIYVQVEILRRGRLHDLREIEMDFINFFHTDRARIDHDNLVLAI